MDYKEKFIKMNPNMENEEFPETLNEFCEFIIQQNAKMANAFFVAHAEVTNEFLTYFKPTKGKCFYRGGFSNLDRKFLSVSENKKVAMNFAIHGNNYEEDIYKTQKGTKEFYEVTSESYYKPLWGVFGEEEIFLWKPRIVKFINLEMEEL